MPSREIAAGHREGAAGAGVGEDTVAGSRCTAGAGATGERFDYGGLDAAAAHRARGIAERIRRRANDFYVETGRDLIAAQEALGHGRFGAWLAAEFGWTDRTARNFMGAARLAEGNSEIVSVLPATAIYKLAAPGTPDSVRREVVARARTGEVVTVKGITEAIADAKLREADARAERVGKARLERRLRGKSPKAAARISKEAERKRRQQEAERDRRRLEDEEAAAAAGAAVDLLASRLGPDLSSFADLFKRAGPWRVEAELAAAMARS